MAEKHIHNFAYQKNALANMSKPYTPFELYLDDEWQAAVVPKDTVYVTAAASSGGYRAFQTLFGIEPSGRRQSHTIRMNARLVANMVNLTFLPQELRDKAFIVPHEIGKNIPNNQGTLLGRNEAHLMMQWMMRIAGVTKKTARQFCATMENDEYNVIGVIGKANIPKVEKIPHYLRLMQTFINTLESHEPGKPPEPRKPLSAMILGLDWKNSLGSRLEAVLAYHLNIPVYEMRFDDSHPDFQAFMKKFRLDKIKDLIHLPVMHWLGENLICVERMHPFELEKPLKDILSNLRFPSTS